MVELPYLWVVNAHLVSVSPTRHPEIAVLLSGPKFDNLDAEQRSTKSATEQHNSLETLELHATDIGFFVCYAITCIVTDNMFHLEITPELLELGAWLCGRDLVP